MSRNSFPSSSISMHPQNIPSMESTTTSNCTSWMPTQTNHSSQSLASCSMSRMVEINPTGLLSRSSRTLLISNPLENSMQLLWMSESMWTRLIRKNCTTTTDHWLHQDVLKSSNGLWLTTSKTFLQHNWKHLPINGQEIFLMLEAMVIIELPNL